MSETRGNDENIIYKFNENKRISGFIDGMTA